MVPGGQSSSRCFAADEGSMHGVDESWSGGGDVAQCSLLWTASGVFSAVWEKCVVEG